jgi:tRNA U34 5-carboxymethylaminomethyl modifying GTPase MnmE/TrmE
MLDGQGEPVFFIPSVFTGSFVLEACCHGGLILYAQSGPGADTLLTINWREADQEIC